MNQGHDTVLLSDSEREQLQQQHNYADDWDAVRISPGCDLTAIRHCVFSGVVDIISPYRLHRATLTDCALLQDTVVVDSRIHGYVVGARALITGSELHYSNGCRVNEVIISAVPESGDYPLPLFTKYSFSDYVSAYNAIRGTGDDGGAQSAEAAPSSTQSQQARIGDDVRITGGSCVRDSHIGNFAEISGGASLENVYLASARGDGERVSVSGAAYVANSVLMRGVRVSSHACVECCHIFEYTRIAYHALVAHSIIATDCHFERGEIRASIIGPLVNLHHNSMLISVFWPAGRGNIGSGALYGANHTTRKANQVCHLAEGFWAGLRSSGIMPLNLSDAPYLTIAATVTLHPQRIAFPFSLITPTHRAASQGALPPAHLNRIIPAWALYRNMYALLRSWHKHVARDHATHTPHAPFRRDIVECVLRAQESLERGVRKNDTHHYYTPEHIPELGDCYALKRDILKAQQAYQRYVDITRYFLMHGILHDEVFQLASDSLHRDLVNYRRIFGGAPPSDGEAADEDSVIAYFRRLYAAHAQ